MVLNFVINIFYVKFLLISRISSLHLDLTLSYLKEWLVHLFPICEKFDWIELRENLAWLTGSSPVKNSADVLLQKGLLETKDFDQLFAEFTHVKNYLQGNANILEEWNGKNVPIVDRWMNVFNHLKRQSLSFGVFFKLVEYVLVVPGKFILPKSKF